MLINNIYSSKDCSLSSVGADHPEFTPLEREKNLSMKGEAHKWEEVILGTLYFSIVGGGHASMEGKPTSGRR